MLALSRMGAIILPPMPAFYNNPETVNDIVNHIVARTLDQFNIDNSLTKRWKDNPKNPVLGAHQHITANIR